MISNRCERCYKEGSALIGSIFNTQMICLKCEEKEKDHPEYEKAKRLELEEVKKGNYNYEGIGLPSDL